MRYIYITAVFLVFTYSGLAQDADPSAEADVPAALSTDCTWERRDDAQKPWTLGILFKTFRPFTELECRDECNKSVICGYATFNNRTRECRLIQRRAFHQSFLTRQGLYVMWEKKCPVEHIWNRTDDPAKMVMCPMERSSGQLSVNYAYKFAKYINDVKDAVWWCQRDPVCQGIYKNATANVHVFLYKAVLDESATGDNSQITVKNCTPSGPLSGSKCFFTAYNRKTVRGKPYSTMRNLNFRECYTTCSNDPNCYAAYAREDRFRTSPQKCKLYKKDKVIGLGRFKKMFDDAKVWLRNACHE